MRRISTVFVLITQPHEEDESFTLLISLCSLGSSRGSGCQVCKMGFDPQYSVKIGLQTGGALAFLGVFTSSFLICSSLGLTTLALLRITPKCPLIARPQQLLWGWAGPRSSTGVKAETLTSLILALRGVDNHRAAGSCCKLTVH